MLHAHFWLDYKSILLALMICQSYLVGVNFFSRKVNAPIGLVKGYYKFFSISR
jgi:hypothetical protein